jgi:unsaturated chondroitin disaccharide hydrolase
LNDELFSSALILMLDRVAEVLHACEQRFPLYVADDGRWYTTPDGNWCAGHWIGLLWIAAKRAHDAETRHRFTTAARMHINSFEPQSLGHIFAGMNHYYAGFLGFDVDGADELRLLGFRGADAMLRLYDPLAKQIPVGRYSVAPSAQANTDEDDWIKRDLEHLAAVDVIHTSVPILWRAYAESGDSRYYDTAVAHVKRHLEWHVRPDGSTTQLRPYDAESGEPGEPLNLLAENPNGCWSRGLAWHIAGLAEAFVATGDAEWLDALERSTTYYVTNTPRDLVPAWDTTCTSPRAPRDASAAAITAYGLIKLGVRGDHLATAALEQVGARILGSLATDYLAREDKATERGGVLHGCYRYPQGLAIDNELIWADFYTAAALDLIAS